MKENDGLKVLFDQARSEKPIADINSVEKLVKSGKRISAGKLKLGKPGRGLFNPLNLIIMISTIAIITSLFIIFNGNPDEKIIEEDFGVHVYEYPESIREAEPVGEISKDQNESTASESGDSEEVILISPGIRKVEIETTVLEKDTIVKGEILHLNKDELKKIGFSFDEDGYYYLNELPDRSKINLWSYSHTEDRSKASSVGFGRGGYVNPVIKIDAAKRNYYPVCTSDLNGKDIRPMQGLPDDFVNRFEYYNDTLVPVVLSWSELGGKRGNNRIAWFKVSLNFYEDLGLLYTLQKEPNHNGYKVVFDYSYSQLNIGRAIVLDHSLIPNLGFSLTADSLVYRYGKNVEFWVTSFGSGVQSLGGDIKLNQSKVIDKPMLCAVTDILTKGSMNVNPNAFYEVDSTIRGNDWIDICIPIRFSNEKEQLWEGNTFWFYPNEWLFKNLPYSIGIPMRAEYNVNVAPKLRGTDNITAPFISGGVRAPKGYYDEKTEEESVPCEYFPTFCEGLPGLDDINVFPNPATELLNVEISISRPKTIDFRIFDISGRLMLEDVETQKYDDAGHYRQQIDLSSLEEGFYLLVLTDDEGGKMTRRVIKN